MHQGVGNFDKEVAQCFEDGMKDIEAKGGVIPGV